MTKRALYPGTFDPLTYGHLNIIERAVDVFDEVVVAIAYNSQKKTLFSKDERIEMIRQQCVAHPTVTVEAFVGLTVKHAEDRGCKVLLRGLRTISDFEYEFQLAHANKTLAPDVETCFMMTNEGYGYFSSSLIKEIAMLGGDVTKMVPPEIEKRILEKYADR